VGCRCREVPRAPTRARAILGPEARPRWPGTEGQVLRYQEGRYQPLLRWHHELLETVPSIVTGALRSRAVGGLEPAGE